MVDDADLCLRFVARCSISTSPISVGCPRSSSSLHGMATEGGGEGDAPTAQLQTITERLAFHRKRGKAFALKAEQILLSKPKAGAFLKFDDAAMYFYKSSISYRICGRFREGAEVLKRCAEMHERLKLYAEAATLYTEVSEIFMKVDKGEAMAMTTKAVSIYCDAGRFDVAGRMERKMADIHYTAKHWEEAAFHYRKAANFLSGEQLLDQSDHCMEQAAFCMMELNELQEAQKLWELVAEGCVQSNLRRFHARDKLFFGILCMFGAEWKYPVGEVDMASEESTPDAIIARTSYQKYSEIEVKIVEYEMIDYMWRVAKEIDFFKNIIKHRLAFELHELVDHVYYWNNVRPLSRFQLAFLNVMIIEVKTELDRRSELRRLEAMRKELAVQRREKRAELKKKFLELGIQEGISLEQMEKEYEEDEKAVADTATHLTLIWGKTTTKRPVGELAPDDGGEGQEGGVGGEDKDEEGGEAEKGEAVFDDDDDDDDDDDIGGGDDNIKRKTRKKRTQE